MEGEYEVVYFEDSPRGPTWGVREPNNGDVLCYTHNNSIGELDAKDIAEAMNFVLKAKTLFQKSLGVN